MPFFSILLGLYRVWLCALGVNQQQTPLYRERHLKFTLSGRFLISSEEPGRE